MLPILRDRVLRWWLGPPPAAAGRPPESLARRARRLEIRSRRLLGGARPGGARSPLRGGGIEFDSVREYVVGDDLRAIDWNVTARAGRPFVKTFVPARDRDVIVAVDRSASMAFGSVRNKSDLAADAALLLAHAALASGDRVGLAELGADGIAFLPPRRGPAQAQAVLRRLLGAGSAGALDWSACATAMLRVQPRRSALFVLSDFEGVAAEPAVRALARVAGRHETLALQVFDPAERALAGLGLVEGFDPETGERFALDAGDPGERRQFARNAEARRVARCAALSRAGIASIELSTAADPLRVLEAYFRRRSR